jgi:hypothetical protein
MPKKSTHERAKAQAAGKTGRKEVPIKGGRRIDAMTKNKATEVERGGPKQLEKAARRLKASGKPQRVLTVPTRSMPKARTAMRKVGVTGTVRNLAGTRRSHVPQSSNSRTSSRKT